MLSNKGYNQQPTMCPYDPSHPILPYHAQIHLVKCRRDHPDHAVSICMFNAIHHVPTVDLEYHHEVCPNRDNLDRYAITTENVNPDRFVVEQPNIAPEENWDNIVHPTYNPDDYCKNNLILRNKVIQTQSPAKKRLFKMAERQRIQELIKDQETVIDIGSNTHKVVHYHPVNGIEIVDDPSVLVNINRIDVAHLLAKVNLSSTILTTPKLSAVKTEGVTIKNKHEMCDSSKEPTFQIQHSLVGNTSSTVTVTRRTETVPRTQNGTVSGRTCPLPRWPIAESNSQNASAKSTRWKPSVTNSVLDERNFPYLGARCTARVRDGSSVSRN